MGQILHFPCLIYLKKKKVPFEFSFIETLKYPTLLAKSRFECLLNIFAAFSSGSLNSVGFGRCPETCMLNSSHGCFLC